MVLEAARVILCAAISAAEPGVDSASAYDATLREILGVRPFEDEVSGADFALRAVIVPAFHSECAVTVIRRGAETTMLVRCADDSVWHSVSSPRLEGKKPKEAVGVIADRFTLRADEVARLEKVAAATRAPADNPGAGLDGMTTTFEVLLQGTTSKLTVWHGMYGGAPDDWMHGLARVIREHGSKTARFAAHWSAYLKDPAPEDRDHTALIAFSAASVALGVGAGLTGWFARDGTLGRVGAITAGTLGTAFLVASVAFAIAYLTFSRTDMSNGHPGLDRGGLRAGIFFAAIASVVGLIGGAVASAFATAPPGVGRGAIGLVGGGLTALCGASLLIAAW